LIGAVFPALCCSLRGQQTEDEQKNNLCNAQMFPEKRGGLSSEALIFIANADKRSIWLRWLVARALLQSHRRFLDKAPARVS
jgi:hypothetical protein